MAVPTHLGKREVSVQAGRRVLRREDWTVGLVGEGGKEWGEEEGRGRGRSVVVVVVVVVVVEEEEDEGQ